MLCEGINSDSEGVRLNICPYTINIQVMILSLRECIHFLQNSLELVMLFRDLFADE